MLVLIMLKYIKGITMQKDWSSYKITMFLYFGVLLLPINFYISYSFFNEIVSDNKALNELLENKSDILMLQSASNSLKNKIIMDIDTKFEDLKPWVLKNNSNDFYINEISLNDGFSKVLQSWNQDHLNTDKIYKELQPLLKSIQNMITLKQNKMQNIFYINFLLTMAFLIIIIFFIRSYIYKQLHKNTLYDFETKLYSKDYLLAVIKDLSARMQRDNEPLSVLYISIDDLKEDESKSEKEHKRILKNVSELILQSVRDSDIACRYSRYEFMVILPNTHAKNIEAFIGRIHKNIIKFTYQTKIIEHYKNESYDVFINKFTNL